jgi:hypothetical protein
METVRLMELMAVVMPILAATVGVLLTFMVGQINAKLNGITTSIVAVETRLKEQIKDIETRMAIRLADLETKHYTHLTHPNIHAEAVARLSEQITTLLKTVQVAHERIDKFEHLELICKNFSPPKT